jgi:hypothetical protein
MKIPAYSMNEKLITTPYKAGDALKPEIRNGLAWVKAKVDLIGLTLLVEARLNDGNYLPVGTVIYLLEDVLNGPTAKWAKDVRRCAALGNQEFIIVDKNNVVMVDTQETVE